MSDYINIDNGMTNHQILATAAVSVLNFLLNPNLPQSTSPPSPPRSHTSQCNRIRTTRPQSVASNHPYHPKCHQLRRSNFRLLLTGTVRRTRLFQISVSIAMKGNVSMTPRSCLDTAPIQKLNIVPRRKDSTHHMFWYQPPTMTTISKESLCLRSLITHSVASPCVKKSLYKLLNMPSTRAMTSKTRIPRRA